MKLSFLLLILLINPAHAEKSYNEILSDYAKPYDSTRMRKVTSDYEPSIEKCFKGPLSNYNVTFRQREAEFKFEESLECYKEENSKLPLAKQLKFEDCKDRETRNEAYDLAYCYQGLFVGGHNYHGY